MSRYKFTIEQKLKILAWIDEGHGVNDAVAKFQVGRRTINRWRVKLAADGQEALTSQPRNNRYPVELKVQAVEAYLAGEDSLRRDMS